MRRSPKLSTVLVLAAVAAFSLGATSCGGGGGSGSEADLVLTGFNIPNIAGVALNQPLMFTFSAEIDPDSITPDTLRVVGSLGPNFETTVVDGNLVALIPRSPNFADYSDAGLLPGVQYTVDFAVFPAPSTIRTPSRKPLLSAESFQFVTDPNIKFIETRRPIHTGAPPGDAAGCLNNSANSLDTTAQFGSGPGARLLCLKNEGAPQVIWDECSPQHGDEAVGTPSVTPGLINLPALRVRCNEPLDPLTVVPWNSTEKESTNIQLWLVGDTDKNVAPDFEHVRVNKPLIVQSLEQTEMILVAANEDATGLPVGGVPQGTYLINITRNVTDLNGIPLAIDEDLPAGSFANIDAAVDSSPAIPNGYRIYFVSLVVPGSRQSIIESFEGNLSEWGDALSGDTEPGVFTYPDTPTDPDAEIPGVSVSPSTSIYPAFTLTDAWPGQTTTSTWNDGFRFWNLDTLAPNPDVSVPDGNLQAVWQPFLGGGSDGKWESRDVGDTSGAQVSISSSPTSGNSVNGDGIYEVTEFTVRANDQLSVVGSQPLIILCRGDFIVEAGATILLNGSAGGAGLDTDGSSVYTNPGAISPGGAGGLPGAGGGTGGTGADPIGAGTLRGVNGNPYLTVFGAGPADGGGVAGFANPTGGGGGGLALDGEGGTTEDDPVDGIGVALDTIGKRCQEPLLQRALALFLPDRGYSPNANGSGGTGGGGGGANDTGSTGTAENGDDGGGGGGGGGGGLYVIAGGQIIMNGTIEAKGGTGGSVFHRDDQIITDPDDEVAGDEFVSGVVPGASPSGSGGPGGGGSGGTVFLCGMTSVTIGGTIEALGGVGGQSGQTDTGGPPPWALVGGNGSVGIVVLASADTNDISAGSSITPPPEEIVYSPTVKNVSTGVSRWYDMSTATTVFKGLRWESNFPVLHQVGVDQGSGTPGGTFDAYVEMQGADTLVGDPPTSATGLTTWVRLNANDWEQNRVVFDPESAVPFDPDANDPPAACPIDLKRFFRFRWRFNVPDDYRGYLGGPTPAVDMPQIRSTTIEFER